jgi:hypothetical protein
VTTAEEQRETAKDKRKPPRGKPFPKGVSGNPKGRPASQVSIAEFTRAYLESDGRLEALVASLLAKATDEGNVSAALLLLDRAYGKSVDTVKLETVNTPPPTGYLGLLGVLGIQERPQGTAIDTSAETVSSLPPFIDAETEPVE